jgi:hypothetical protein
MRTTLDLPDDLFRNLKTLAAQRGTTLKQLLHAAVERELERARQQPHRTRLSFPLLDSKEPGKLQLTNADIEDFLT